MRQIAAAGETFSWDRDIAEEDDDGRILGTAEMGRRLGGPAAHTASAGFMVDPAHEGRGAGRALCERVIDQARADGYRSIVFNAVVETNVRAVRASGLRPSRMMAIGRRQPSARSSDEGGTHATAALVRPRTSSVVTSSRRTLAFGARSTIGSTASRMRRC